MEKMWRWLAPLALLITIVPLIGASQSAAPLPQAPAALSYAFATLGTVHVYRPARDPAGVVLFLSDSNGISAAETGIAKVLAGNGMLVALLSTPDMMKGQKAAGGRCLNLNYPLVDLSNDVQHRMGVKAYMKPLLIGMGEGGTLAYATLSQWANGSYTGAISIGFQPRVATVKPWCTAPGFSAERDKDQIDWKFGPNRMIRLPWIVMNPADVPVRQSKSMENFVKAVPGARLVSLPSDNPLWPDPVMKAALAMLPRAPSRAQTGPLPIPPMPLSVMPVSARAGGGNNDLMAIIYSGDGGWVGIDRDVADQLVAKGIPVVGVDSLSYFWTARTPDGASRDMGALINAFSRHWGRSRVLLVGYSFGADAMPYMVDRLDPATRAKVARISLLGLSSTADFQFHLSSWLNVSSDTSLPTIPAIQRLRGVSIQCVRGEDEDDSACGDIPGGLAQQYLVPGGHHFGRNAPLLASIIMGQHRPGTISE